MKICILTHDINPGNGWGRYASTLVSGYKKAGHQVLVLKEVKDNTEGEAILYRRFGIIKSVLLIIQKTRDADIMHALDVYPYGIIAWLTSFFTRAKIVISVQGSYSIAPLHNKTTSWFARRAVRGAEKIVAISRYTAEALKSVVPGASVIVVNHGVDLSFFKQKHVPPDDVYILSVGALKYRKGYHVSIPAFARVLKTNPNLRYIIVGDQDDQLYFQELKQIVSELGIENSIKFIEKVSDLELLALYRSAKLFVLTSVNEGYHFEGFGLVFLEAAAAGIPVVGTTGNGIVDAVCEGKNSILVDQNDVEAAHLAIRKLVNDEKLWESMSRESVLWADSHDDGEMIKKYMSLYQNLLARK